MSRISDLESEHKHLTLKEIWELRDRDGLLGHTLCLVTIKESDRRRFEASLGRVVSTFELGKILSALLRGEVKLHG